MKPEFDIDHTSFAVQDAMGWARRLRRELGAVPVCGEVLAEFRYLLLYVGTADAGGRLELLEPVGAGFLSRFLSARGEGPHHLTFTVPDLATAVRQVRSLGLTVVGESYDHPAWREAFVLPDAVHRTVIQLAQSDKAYPDPRELVESSVRDPSAMPDVAGATEPLWWTPLWDTAVEVSPASLGPTHLGSGDPALSRRLFEDVLGAQVSERDGSMEYTWPSGSIRVHGGGAPGITGITGISLYGGPAEGVAIGSCRLAGK
ncbi:VOC family protein [Streptomyces sp. CA-249302]|uniref:VOC family protein n=1 Tax=Streptomyces sp. CA-249302 TaxID=3240058 RepID=UPI003D8A28D0